MKYAKLGNTDIEVSKICIGGMSFGEASKNFHEWTLNQEESTKMIKDQITFINQKTYELKLYSCLRDSSTLKQNLTNLLLAVVRIMCLYPIPKNRGNAWAAAIRKIHAPTTIIIFFLKSY